MYTVQCTLIEKHRVLSVNEHWSHIWTLLKLSDVAMETFSRYWVSSPHTLENKCTLYTQKETCITTECLTKFNKHWSLIWTLLKVKLSDVAMETFSSYWVSGSNTLANECTLYTQKEPCITTECLSKLNTLITHLNFAKIIGRCHGNFLKLLSF